MSSRVIESLRQADGVKFHRKCDLHALQNLRNELGFCLPSEHEDVLSWSNGIDVYHGYFRLFGISSVENIDSMIWNQNDCWKFAWNDRAVGYWCFCETAWGDQYAYSLEALRSGHPPEVYFLSAFSMTSHVVAPSFKEFLEGEFVRLATSPYDTTIVRAREKYGPLEIGSHLIYVPSILLSGSEDTNSVEKMSSRLAMIFNGDIAMQLDAAAEGKIVRAIEPYEDEMHRMRLRVLWV